MKEFKTKQEFKEYANDTASIKKEIERLTKDLKERELNIITYMEDNSLEDYWTPNGTWKKFESQERLAFSQTRFKELFTTEDYNKCLVSSKVNSYLKLNK